MNVTEPSSCPPGNRAATRGDVLSATPILADLTDAARELRFDNALIRVREIP
jgi:hypothetical protein